LLERAEQSETGALHKTLSANHSLLDYPHYTRPADFRGWKVPEVLVGGNHAEVAKWRREQALQKTQRNRPDLVSGA
jgi:tRNA (guanine37-N1)-methyltransferase